MPSSIPLPELLAPAGNREKLETAVAYGADAVYLGGTAFNLRAKAQGFSPDRLLEALDFAHAHGVKVYYCLNILAWEKHLPGVMAQLEQLGSLPVDALIIADPGIVRLAQKITPHIPIHLSTQANTSNSASAMFWKDMGVSRINLARELGASAIRAIAQSVKSELELELFVHGAMCMAISGRCLLSAHLNQRSANQGLCTHPCRFDYKTVAIRVDERTRPGEGLWEITQDEEYSRILSAQDLCLVKYLPWFIKNRITSLKIEGRMKTSAYLCQVVDAYRTALDDAASKNFRPGTYVDCLSQAATRPLSSGFFCPRRQIFFTPQSEPESIILARIIRRVNADSWIIAVKNPWDVTGPVAIMAPGLKRPVLGPDLFRVEKETGEGVTQAHPGLNYVLRSDHPDLAPHLFLQTYRANRT
ncbi:peptidase U32 family protein [Desulfoplanes formicivorans]|uniref:Peptidase U32 n=1 Tax=Desulfoplanes formicivorans TaxID=1592317 RepID=A0A194ACZ7_9BACT|nr:peptidase U32 family protein [Desulfoplanes formicivorans]GAU07982.1 peptidase U32 [Desulfoplanes formicivorans]